jgi:hypothetical protein
MRSLKRHTKLPGRKRSTSSGRRYAVRPSTNGIYAVLLSIINGWLPSSRSVCWVTGSFGSTLLTRTGHIVDMAYELGIHRTFESLANRNSPTVEDLMQIRLWLTVTIQDY